MQARSATGHSLRRRSKVGVLATSKALQGCLGSPKAKPSRTMSSPGRLGVTPATWRPGRADVKPAGPPAKAADGVDAPVKPLMALMHADAHRRDDQRHRRPGRPMI